MLAALRHCTFGGYTNHCLEVSKLLLAHGADIGVVTNGGFSVFAFLLDCLSSHGYKDLAMPFLDLILLDWKTCKSRGQYMDEEVRSAFENLKMIISVLAQDLPTTDWIVREMGVRRHSPQSIVPSVLALGGDVNFTTENGVTALHYAVRGGHLDQMKELLMAGADFEAVFENEPKGMSWSTSPLTTAVRRVDVSAVRLLLEHGADPNNPVTWMNGTCLMNTTAVEIAASCGCKAIKDIISNAASSRPLAEGKSCGFEASDTDKVIGSNRVFYSEQALSTF